MRRNKSPDIGLSPPSCIKGFVSKDNYLYRIGNIYIYIYINIYLDVWQSWFLPTFAWTGFGNSSSRKAGKLLSLVDRCSSRESRTIDTNWTEWSKWITWSTRYWNANVIAWAPQFVTESQRNLNRIQFTGRLDWLSSALRNPVRILTEQPSRQRIP